MIFHKNKKAISKAMALGMIATSSMPLIALNEKVDAAKVTEATKTSKSTKVVKVTCDALNVRKKPNKKCEIVGVVTKGTKLTYISKEDGWYKVKYKGHARYISGKYSKLVNDSKDTDNTDNTKKDSIKKVGKVTVSSLNVRKGPGTNYGIKKVIKKGSVVGIISSKNGWAKVKLSKSVTGYVYLGSLKVYPGNSKDIKVSYKKSSSDSNKNVSSNKKINKVVATAKAQVGKPYVYGAEGPNSFDCSGLTYYCYKKVGITLNRSSRAQASNGTHVSKSNLKPGDLIFFNSGTSSIHHVGMYVGNNKFIHAPSPGKRVKYESLSTSWYVKGYVTARRIIK